MGIMHRIWSRDTDLPDSSLALAERLRTLSEGQGANQIQDDRNELGEEGPLTSPTALAEERQGTPANEADAEAPSEVVECHPPLAPENHQPIEPLPGNQLTVSDKGESPLENPLNNAPLDQIGTPPVGDGIVSETTVEAEEPLPQSALFFSPALFGTESVEPNTDESLSCKTANESPLPLAVAGDHVGEVRQQQLPEPSFSAFREFGAPFVDLFKTEAEEAGKPREDSSRSVEQALAGLQTARQEFEAEIGDRLDHAIGECKRRMPSEAFFNEAAAEFEQRATEATDRICLAINDQASSVLSAVVSEIRAFHEQLFEEIQGRVELLDSATRQALQLKADFEAALPQAREMLQSLQLTGQQAADRLQAAADLSQQLHSSHEDLSQDIEIQRNRLQTLMQECRQEESRLKQQLGNLRGETRAAGDLVARVADQSLEHLKAGAIESDTRPRSDVENRAGEIVQRLPSTGRVERTSALVEQAKRKAVEPATERIPNASHNAESTADSHRSTGSDAVARMGAVRRKLDSRLATLKGEKQSGSECSLAGLQRKVTEDFGNLVERIVAQSSEQLDQRIHSLCSDLLTLTDAQIKGATPATFGTVQDGLLMVFEQPAAEPDPVPVGTDA